MPDVCPLCRHALAQDVTRVTRHGVMYPIVQCASCALIYVNPRPSATAIRAYYLAQGEGASYATLMQQAASEGQLYAHRFRRRLREMARFARPPGRLLDVGCQLGLFLAEAQQLGWDVAGVELSPAAAEAARARSRATVTTGELIDAHYPDASVDVVTCWHLIEHVLDPLVLLREVRRILTPDGLLAMETPNIASQNFRRQREAWEYLTPPEHINYFDRSTLTSALARCGFRVQYVTYDAGTNVGHTLTRCGLGALRQWGRRHYRWIAPLRQLYIASLGRLQPQDDMLVEFAQPQATPP